MRPLSSGSVALVLALTLCGCHGNDTAQSVPAPPPPEVQIAQAITRDVIDFGEFTGRTDSSQTVDVRCRVTGYLQKIDFTDGQEVKSGDELFQIDPRPFAAELENANGQKAQWEAKQARAQADVKRYEGLVPTGAASAQDLDKARADLGEATAAIKSSDAVIDRANLDLEFARVTAPLSGQIGRALISKGNLIRADNDVLTTIVALDPMYVYFDVDERTLLQFRAQAIATGGPDAVKGDVKDLKIPVYVGLANEEGYPHAGVINFADNKVDAATGTIRLRGTFDNSKRVFKPGFYTRVRVPISSATKAVLVSDRAIGTDQSQKFAYVVDDKNTVHGRAVKLGRLEDDGLRVITQGLQSGDAVIVAGLQRARPDKPVTPKRVEMPRTKVGADTEPAVIVPGKSGAAKSAGQP